MANLFDLGIVFALGRLMATLSFLNLPELLDRDAQVTLVKNPARQTWRSSPARASSSRGAA
jgi:hypothetical protein